MAKPIQNLTIILFSIAAFGCASTTNSGSQSIIIREAENTPEAFVPREGVSFDENSCKSPMIDPRDSTEIIMVSASNGQGTYSAPQGKYGLKKGEFLRLNCSSGKVIGVVKK